jgi:hypothetical protein
MRLLKAVYSAFYVTLLLLSVGAIAVLIAGGIMYLGYVIVGNLLGPAIALLICLFVAIIYGEYMGKR